MNRADIAVIVMLVASLLGLTMVYLAMALDTQEELPQGDSDFPPLDYTQYRGYWD